MATSLRNLGAFPAIEDSNTKEKYYSALGEFIETYARAEGMTHALLGTISEIPINIIQPITGGSRLRDLVGPIKKIAIAKKKSEEIRGEIEKVFNHFNSIAELRDRLIHRGASISEGKLLSTNMISMKSLEDYEELKFDVSDLHKATQDLRAILLRLYLIIHPDDPDISVELREELFLPWQYKPLKPDTPNRPTRAKSQFRKRQRRSSQA